MIIHSIDFPIYKIITLASIFLGALYIFVSLKNRNMNKKHIFIFFILFFVLAIFVGKLYTLIIDNDTRNFFQIGLSGYGGLIGVIIASFIYSRIYNEKYVVKYTIISLPLIYSFAKIACLLNGCCYGIPYDGILSVTYIDKMNIPVFPIQLVEVIAFNIIFQICNRLHNREDIIYITLITISIVKFSLDFFRYSHINQIISPNQIFSIILLFITIILYLYNKKRNT